MITHYEQRAKRAKGPEASSGQVRARLVPGRSYEQRGALLVTPGRTLSQVSATEGALFVKFVVRKTKQPKGELTP